MRALKPDASTIDPPKAARSAADRESDRWTFTTGAGGGQVAGAATVVVTVASVALGAFVGGAGSVVVGTMEDATGMAVVGGDGGVMVAGGTEAAVCRIGMAGFAALRALSTGFNDTPEKASRAVECPAP